jgi:Ca2+-transporting ATPase
MNESNAARSGYAWHTLPPQEVFRALDSGPGGLTADEAARRLSEQGPNELTERKGRGPLRMLWDQFTETMVLILLAAGILSAVLGKGLEAAAILTIVFLFATLGFVQEYRAEKAMAALRRLAVPRVRVRRDGVPRDIPASELVTGDLVLMEAGAAVPADARVVEAAAFRVQESALTGEPEPVEKGSDPVSPADLPLGDRTSMVYLGTAVTYGRGAAVVTATGMATELGRVATLIQEVPSERTPLQRKLDQTGHVLAWTGGGAALLVMLVGVARGETWAEMLLTAVSVAVAVVPEGLPAVVTITLALGAQRMLHRRALIRRLPAVETLGSVTVICTDKTGTLTENRMTVMVVDTAGHRYELQETLRGRRTEAGGECPEPADLHPAVALTLACGALCSDATLLADAEDGRQKALGDPTEAALVVAAAHAGMRQPDLSAAFPRTAEIPFDSDRKRMTTVHRGAGADRIPPALQPLAGRMVAITKGSVDGLLPLATGVWVDGAAVPLTAERTRAIGQTMADMAGQGMRVLGVAFRLLPESHGPAAPEMERDLVLVGLVGLLDPPRESAREAVSVCRAAGIRPVMITGDHPLTAVAIARTLGLAEESEAVSGESLARFGDQGLAEVVPRATVYARVSPEDKLRIVGALQARGEVVAMTGDGVNDAPALKKADIGVAMGITGTDVAKEAADMVLLDDNFATIVAAVEEGRTVFDNLLRFVKFSLGGNLGKVLVMLGAPLLDVNVALRPLQLLWLNLLTDGLLGLGLGTEPPEASVMRRPPRLPGMPVLDRTTSLHVAWTGSVIALLTLGAGVFYRGEGHPGETAWQTMVFAVIGFTQIGHALGLRPGGRPALLPAGNPLLTATTAAAILLQLGAIYLPASERFFGLDPLPPGDLALAAGLGVLVYLAVRLETRFTNR